MSAGRPARFLHLTGALALVMQVAGCPRRTPTDDPPEEDQVVAVTERLAIDHEPNDSPDEASDLSMGGTGQVGPRDVDYYRSHRSPDLWSLELTSSSPDAVRVDVIRRGQDLPESIEANSRVHVGRSHPDVLVVVRPLGSEPVDYALSLQAVEIPETVTVLAEPVDSEFPAVVETIPIRMIGYYDGAEDRDAFDVMQNAYPLQTPFAVEVSPVPGARPSLTVLNPDGGRVAEVVAEQEGDGVGIPNMGFWVSETLWRFEVRNLSDATPVEPYTISIHAPELPTEYVDLEPNDGSARSQLITLDSTLTGVFHRDDDLDWFRLHMNQPGALTITAVPDPTTDIAFEWFPDRMPSVRVDSAGIGEPEIACGLAAPSGQHQLEIAARAVHRGSMPRYTMIASPVSGNIEQEPNGPDQPNLVELVTDATGFIGVAGDVDVFSYHVGITPIDVPNVYDFTLTLPGGVDADLEIVDAEGGALGASRSAGPGAPERIQVELGRGEYRVLVRGVAGVSCEERYSLTVSN